jgi:hypothetical protein
MVGPDWPSSLTVHGGVQPVRVRRMRLHRRAQWAETRQVASK